MANKNQYKAKDFIDAIPGTGGIISAIARKVGCTWDTAKKYIDEYPTIQAAYQNECESVLDMAESVIFNSIQNKDSRDAKWYLTRKGKVRGYGDSSKHEITGPDGGPVETTNDEQYNRTLSTLADALGGILSQQGTSEESDLDPAE